MKRGPVSSAYQFLINKNQILYQNLLNSFKKWVMHLLHMLILFSSYTLKKIHPSLFWILTSAFAFRTMRCLLLYSTKKSKFQRLLKTCPLSSLQLSQFISESLEIQSGRKEKMSPYISLFNSFSVFFLSCFLILFPLLR